MFAFGQKRDITALQITADISFPLRISSVNEIKSARNCGFGHIY